MYAALGADARKGHRGSLILFPDEAESSQFLFVQLIVVNFAVSELAPLGNSSFAWRIVDADTQIPGLIG